MRGTEITTSDDERLYYGSNISQAPLKANKGSFFIITDNGLENGNIIDTYVFTKVWEKIGGIELSDIPDATETQRGLVNTGTQTFKGNKVVKGEATGNPFEVKDYNNISCFSVDNLGNAFIKNGKRFGINLGVAGTEVSTTYVSLIVNWLKKLIIYNSGKIVIGGDVSEGTIGARNVVLLGSYNTTGNSASEQVFDVLGADTSGNSCRLTLIGSKNTGNDNTSFVRIAYKLNELYPSEFRSLTINKIGSFGIGKEITDPSAKLQIESTTQGFLPPRMTQAQREAISLPATGLIVYQTDGSTGLYFKKDEGWFRIPIG